MSAHRVPNDRVVRILLTLAAWVCLVAVPWGRPASLDARGDRENPLNLTGLWTVIDGDDVPDTVWMPRDIAPPRFREAPVPLVQVGGGGRRLDPRRAEAAKVAREIVYWPRVMTVVDDELTVLIAAGNGRRERLRLDGRLYQEDAPTGLRVERRSQRNRRTVTTEIAIPHGPRLTWRYQAGADDTELLVTIDGKGHGIKLPTLHARYRRDDQDPEPPAAR